MRLEATIPESRGAAILKLADELGLTKSQLIDEALTLFLAAVMEVRRGRRLMTMEQGASQPACEIVTPTLSAMEWAMQPEKLALSGPAIEKIAGLTKSPAKASARLRAAAKRHAR
ncbi:MAG: hypothetical protein A2138_01000 [Deltaproteobacteria bacterium RBG_16_71_12]|nr:MAG: hypothetical protein A2138_01000 [Deltaproteobacteria bacterium RBG_16_71_12]